MKRLVGFLLFILAISVFTPALSSGAVVWSDDFQDGDYSGWSVLNGTFSAEDQVLRSTGSGEYYCIQHSSSVAYGNWSFDTYHNASVASHFYRVYSIIADDLVEGSVAYAGVMVPRNGYSLVFAVLGGWIIQWTDGTPEAIGNFHENFSGWRTITITRDNSGLFKLYLNGTLVEETEDNVHKSSEIFAWSAKPGHAIDNVTVSELEPTAIGIDPILIGAGIVAVVVVLVIVVYMRRRT